MILKLLFFFAAFSCAALSIAVYASDGNKPAHPIAPITPCAPGTVYVLMKPGITPPGMPSQKGSGILSAGPSSAFEKVLKELGLREILPFDPAPKKDSINRAFGIDRMYVIYYSNRSIDPHKALAMLERTGDVQCGSARYCFPLSSVPNDSLIAEEYFLKTLDVFNGWNLTTGDTNIVVADVDNAINIDHVDLVNEIDTNWGETGLDTHGNDKRFNKIDDDNDGYIDNWEGWDFCGDVDISDGALPEPNNNPRPRERGASHGTHTAGLLLATGNNHFGIAGMAYGCKLLPLKAAGGGTDIGKITEGFEAIHYASNHGAKIINCSWGGLMSQWDTSFNNIFLLEAHARGALIVAAAGNGINNTYPGVSDDIYPNYPSAGPYVLSVGATDDNSHAAPFSDFGHSVSLWASGDVIWSCDYPGDTTYSSGNGTSYACPIAAGAAALVASLHPTWPPEFIARQLIQTVDNVVNPSNRSDYWGQIDVDSALAIAPWSGLVITGYSIDGTASDSIGAPGAEEDLQVNFQDVLAPGTNIQATLVPNPGVIVNSGNANLGSMNVGTTIAADFHITRTSMYSEGQLPVKLFVTDGNRLADTLSISIPLSVIPGFTMDDYIPDVSGVYATGMKRVSNTAAWASFGADQGDPFDFLETEYALETGSSWGPPTELFDGYTAPENVEAWDSLHAYFGTGINDNGMGPFVIFTNDGADFDTVGVGNFTTDVNAIHFFDPMHGIVIGDPYSNKWGIGTTSDSGNAWNPISIPVTLASGTSGWNNSAAWVGDNGWFGTNVAQIWRTTDAGLTWNPVSTGGNQNSVSVAFDDDGAHGLACFLPMDGNGDTAMMVTADSGASWQTLPTLPAKGIAPDFIQFVPNSNIAMLVSNLGMYRTADFGSTWAPVPIPVGFSPAGCLSISREGNAVVATDNSSSCGPASYAFSIDSNLDVASSQIDSIAVELYPNPAESNTTVSFMLPTSDRVRIVLFDPLGRAVQTVANAAFEAGHHLESLDTKSLMSGTYYIDFETGSGTHVTRILTVIP